MKSQVGVVGHSGVLTGLGSLYLGQATLNSILEALCIELVDSCSAWIIFASALFSLAFVAVFNP